MLPLLLPVVPAGLTWLTAVYTGRSYLRARHDLRVAAYWHSTVLLAAALTVVVPAVYLAIDRTLGLPNAARWIGNSLILIAAYRQDALYTSLLGGSPHAWRRHRQLLVYLVLTLGLMAWMLSLADLRVSTASFDMRSVSPPLIAYRLLYLAFFALVLVRMIRSCMQYGRATDDATVRLSAALDIVGAAWAIVYLVATLLEVVLPASASVATRLNTTIQVSILFAVVFLLAGTTIPSWGPRVGVPALMRQLRLLVAYWRLRSLWRTLVAEAPAVILPVPVRWQAALFEPETLDLLLYRRVIEVLDAWRQLDGIREMHEAATASAKNARRSDAPGSAQAHDEAAHRGRGASATDAETSDENVERHARTDAQHLVETLQYLRRNPGRQGADQPLERGMMTAYRPTSYVEQLHYLERVACHVRAERRRKAVQQLVSERARPFVPKRERLIMAKEHQVTSAPNDAPVSAGQPSDPAYRLAHGVSAVMNPSYVALPTFLVVAVATAPTVWTGVGWWVVTTLGISVAPLLYVALGVRSGRFADHHLSVREQRLVPFVVGLVSAGAALAILLAWHASRALLATVASVVIGVVIAMAITHGLRWKVSLHLGGIAGSVTVFALLFGPLLLVLTPLVALVGWARWRVGAHTAAQAIVATILAVVITVGTFWFMGVPVAFPR